MDVIQSNRYPGAAFSVIPTQVWISEAVCHPLLLLFGTQTAAIENENKDDEEEGHPFIFVWSGVGKCRGIATSFTSNPKAIQTWPALSSNFFIHYKRNSSTFATNKRAEAGTNFCFKCLHTPT